MVHPAGPPNPRPWVLFVCTALAAFAVRTVYILQMADPALNPFFAHPILDAAVHRRWALGILDGTWPPSEPFFRAPLYPYFLAGLYRVFGPDNAVAVQLVHGLVSALGAGLAGLIARRVWGNRSGWFAGMGMAVLWPSIFFSAELLDVTLAVTLNLLLWWLLLRESTWRNLLAAGLVWGLALICRPLILAIAPAVVLYLARRADGPVRDPRRWIALAAGLALAVLPVTVRNVVRGGEPVLVAASGGVNFYIGNNPHTDGRVAFLPGAPMDWQGEMSEVRDLAARETGRPMSALAADRYFWGKGFAFWREHPLDAMKLTARKAWLLLAAGERSNNKSLPFWRARSPLLRWPVWLGWAPVLALAIVGLRRRETDPATRSLMVGSLVLYALALVPFFINCRFRLPLLAWLMVPAGAGADRILRAVRMGLWNPRFRRGLVAAVVILLAVWLPDLIGYRHDPSRDFESWRILGDAYEKSGDLAHAAGSYREALDLDRRYARREYQPLVPALHMRLGGVLAKMGRWREAQGAFGAVVRERPDWWQAYGNLALCYEQTGRPDLARQAWQRVLELHPGDALAKQRLGLR